MSIIEYVKNTIGAILRDIIALNDKDFMEYAIDKNKFVYKTQLPFNISIGDYVFLNKNDYNKSFNN